MKKLLYPLGLLGPAGVLVVTATLASCDSESTGPIDGGGGAGRIPAELIVQPASVTLAVGDTAKLAAIVLDQDGQPFDSTPMQIAWESSNMEVAAVDSRGTVLARKAGAVQIKAKAGALAATAAVVVAAADAPVDPVNAVRISPDTATIVVGDTIRLSAVALDGKGKALETQPTIDWASLDTDVATVGIKGKVRGLTAGTARIVAKAGGKADTASIIVKAPSEPGPDPNPDPNPDPPTWNGPLPAFPEAEGWGATALQSCRSRPLNVIKVTSLADSGPGTLRQAFASIDGSKFNIIIFRVSGYITLSSRIDVSGANCVYVAGQTAPGDGITIRGANGIRFVKNNRDVVIRHLRFRLGYRGDNLGHVGVYVNEGRRFVLDHLSVSWTTDKLVIVSSRAPDSVVDITIQRSILSEVLAHHPTALQLTGEPRENPPNDRISVHRNLLASNSHRNPALGSRNVQFVNNVVYNWNQGASQTSSPYNLARADFVNNFYRTGPMTDPRYSYEITANCESTPGLISYYVAGNVGPHNSDPKATPEDQWVKSRVTACYYKSGGSDGAAIPSSLKVRRDSRLARPSMFEPVVLDAVRARDDVLADVGANRRLTCEGTWTSIQDAVDLRILSEYRNGGGVKKPPTTENDVGGFPSLRGGSACADSDGDGLPDAWEARYPKAADPRGDADGDGYTNIEEYLNGTRPY